MGTAGASDEQIGRAAVTRASWRLLPLVGLGYAIAYMDRVSREILRAAIRPACCGSLDATTPFSHRHAPALLDHSNWTV
jgi:hypothetical protein